MAYPHSSTVTPAEIFESQCPVIMRRKVMLTDSGGAGRQRGGPGQEFELVCVASQPVTLTIRPDLVRFPAPGVFGGHHGARGQVWFNEQIVERFPPMEFRPGDVCIIRVPGGGGYGAPSERQAGRVRQDVTAGLVSPRAAREIYGVEV